MESCYLYHGYLLIKYLYDEAEVNFVGHAPENIVFGHYLVVQGAVGAKLYVVLSVEYICSVLCC